MTSYVFNIPAAEDFEEGENRRLSYVATKVLAAINMTIGCLEVDVV